MKIKLKDKQIVEVVAKKTFDYEGMRMAIHRPVGATVGWVVSEWTTGLRVGYWGGTMQEAKDRAIQHIDNAIGMGVDLTKNLLYNEKIND